MCGQFGRFDGSAFCGLILRNEKRAGNRFRLPTRLGLILFGFLNHSAYKYENHNRYCKNYDKHLSPPWAGAPPGYRGRRRRLVLPFAYFNAKRFSGFRVMVAGVISAEDRAFVCVCVKRRYEI